MAQRRVKHSDPFLVKYQPSELKIASEFLSTWLPFLSKDLCDCCTDVIANRVRSLESGSWNDDGDESNSLCSWKDGENGLPSKVSVTTTTSRLEGESPSMVSVTPKMSWADMAQEDELEEEEEEGGGRESGHQRVNEHPSAIESSMSEVQVKPKLPREQREYLRFMNVKRTKDFICLERVDKKFINIVDGLELHESIFSAAEQKRIVDYVYMLEEKGRNKELKDRTFTAPQKWMRGKGRITIQFGCCYNYATDRKGNPPGILYNEMVDPIPHLFKVIIRRLVQWHVLPPTCVPDSCIVNIYEEGDCIPPHIDNHDFVRPFCTLSFLSECNILFGSSLKIVGPGEFSGPYAIPLPVGSVLVLQGNGADVAKHCVPAVPSKRISITFRRMNENRRPAGYEPEPDLVGIKPLPYVSDKTDNNFSSPRSDQRHSRRHPNRRGSSNFDPRPSGGRTESHSEPRYSSQGRGMFRRPS